MTDEPELILWSWTGDDPPPADMRPDPVYTRYLAPHAPVERELVLSSEPRLVIDGGQ